MEKIQKIEKKNFIFFNSDVDFYCWPEGGENVMFSIKCPLKNQAAGRSLQRLEH
jgi:hypothetical protein